MATALIGQWAETSTPAACDVFYDFQCRVIQFLDVLPACFVQGISSREAS